MTSAKSSSNAPHSKSSGSTFLYTFRTALTGNLALPIVNLLGLCGLMPGLVYLMIRSIRQTPVDASSAVTNIKDQFKFMLIPQTESLILMLIPMLIILISVLMGVMMFRFIASKKTVNVYYSLGITRKNLFLAKYGAGLLLLLVSTALPVLIDILLNISIFGSSTLLWKSGLYYLLGFCLTAFVAFSVTAAVFSAVGTVGEGLFFSLVTLGLPTIVFSCLQSLMERLVWGNPFGHAVEGYSSASLLATFSAYNPLLFMKNALEMFGVVDAKGEMVPSIQGEGTKWVDPNFLTILPWILVGLAALGLALVVFQKRRAEICGFIGVNKVLNTFVTFALSFTAFCLILQYTGKLALALSVLIGALVYLLFYCVIDAILIRNWKQFLHGMVKLPFHIAAVAILFLVFATGLFGFTTRMPDLSEIESVQMTGAAYNQISGANLRTSGGSMMNGGISVSDISLQYVLDASDRDKELARALHQKLIDDKKAPKDSRLDSNIAISYRLKNGKKLLRHYSASTIETLTELLRLDESDTLHQLERENLSAEPQPISEETPDAYRDLTEAQRFQRRFGFETGKLTFLPPDMTKVSSATLGREDFIALKQALIEDLAAQTLQQRYFSREEAIGILCFSEGSYAADKNYYEASVYSAEFQLLSTYSGASYLVVTPSMEHTAAFLAQHALLPLFESDAAISSADVFPVASVYDRMREWHYLTVSYQFGATLVPKPEEDQTRYYAEETVPNTMNVTNAAQLEQLNKASQPHAYTKNEGYFVRFTLSDGRKLSKYLPADSAPQFVKDQIGSL